MNVRGLKDYRRETEPEFRLNPLSRSVKLALVPGLLLGLAPGAAFGAPTGGQVKAGVANISQNGSKSLTSIVQQSQRAAIDWQTFNVQKSQTVQFQQPNVKASTLNRIFDQNPSQIFGNIKANGQVVLMNPNGVFFKPGSQVNVGSLIAGAMQIGIDDFMSGSYRLQALKDAAGRVVNEGMIEAAEGGDVTLVGKSIANRGVIVATAGKVNLVAGEQITVDFDGDGLLRFAVDKEVLDNAVALDDQIENTGDILADGGDVLITASAAEGVFRNAINNSGLVKAGRIQNTGGKIRLVGMGPGASVLNTGQIDASAASADDNGGEISIAAANITNEGLVLADAASGSGGDVHIESTDTTISTGRVSARSASGDGGKVEILGRQVGLFETAEVDVSGGKNGGEALIGGDFQGANDEVQNAELTIIGAQTTIAADAGNEGDGGKVIVWADQSTLYHGSISARGGDTSGDGGFVEVSGKENLTFDGSVDLAAGNGNAGTLLLDPGDLFVGVDPGGTDGADPQTPANTFDEAFNVPADDYFVLAATLTGLDANILLKASNDIIFNADILWGNNTLTDTNHVDFEAGNAITMAGFNIDIDGANLTLDAGAGGITDIGTLIDVGNLTLKSDGAVTQNGSEIITATELVLLGDGTFTLTEANVITSFAADVTMSGSIDVVNAGTITVGSLTANGAGAATDGVTTALGSIDITSNSGGVVLNNDITTGLATVVKTNGDDSVASGDITISAGGTGTISGLGTVTVSTGNATITGTQDSGTADTDDATSGTVMLSSAGGNIDLDFDVVTGSATVDGGTNNSADEATSGTIIVNAGSGGDILGLGTLTTGAASADAGDVDGNATPDVDDVATAGNIILSADDISADGGSALLDVAIGATTENGLGTEGTDGVLNATTAAAASLAMPTTAGAAASITGAFTADSIDFLTATAFTGVNGLRINGPVTRTGSLLIDADGDGEIDINDSVDVSGVFSSVVATGTATFNSTVTSGGSLNFSGDTILFDDINAADMVFGQLTIADDVTMTSTTGRFDFNGDVLSGPAPVLNIVPPAGTDMFIDLIKDVGHIRSDAFGNFTGTLVIGGVFEQGAGSDALIDGTLTSITADYVQVSEDFLTGGNLLLVGSAIEFATTPGVDLEIAAGPVGGGDIALISVGNNADDTNGVVSDGITGGIDLGDISAPTSDNVTITGGQATIASSGEILNSNNIIMNLGGGEVIVAQSDAATNQQVAFNVRSNAVESGISATDTALIASLSALTGGINVFQNARVFFPNPAAVLTILQAVSFVDASLFEIDLSLFGVIGNGIAMSLDQCEDAEGCAPSVTEEELVALINTLVDRISRLEGLLASNEIASEEGQQLLAGYRTQLQNFLNYQQQLADYIARQEADEFGDDFGDEFDDVFEAEETFDVPADEAPVDVAPAFEEPVEEEVFEELEEAIEEPVEEFEDLDEALETFEPAPIEAAPSEPEPAIDDSDLDGSEFEEIDEFEELEEEFDDSLLNQMFDPDSVNQLAGSVRVGRDGNVMWSGDVILPTLHRRY